MKSFINLLPFEYRRKALLRRRLLRWSVVWAACAAVAAGVWWLEHYRSLCWWREKQTAESRYVPLKELVEKCDATRGRLRAMHAKGTILDQLKEERPILSLMGVASDGAEKCHGRLVVRNLLFERHRTRVDTDQNRRKPAKTDKGQPSPPKKAQPWATVTFEGDALDNLAVATFAAGLRDSGLFRRVELKLSLGKTSGNTAVRSFTVECDI